MIPFRTFYDQPQFTTYHLHRVIGNRPQFKTHQSMRVMLIETNVPFDPPIDSIPLFTPNTKGAQQLPSQQEPHRSRAEPASDKSVFLGTSIDAH